MAKLRVPEETRLELEKKRYKVYGHSAVQLCTWTKKCIKDQGYCYKHQFYGVETHRCMQFTPAAIWCQNNCIYCWRPCEYFLILRMDPSMVDGPEEIIDNLVELRKKLLSGFGGSEKTNKEKWKEAQEPNHFTSSLSGEPTLYPFLPEMHLYILKKYKPKSIFLVTNGQEPEMLKKLEDEDALPTQLYISVTAPNEKLYETISRPKYRDAWQRLIESLKFMSQTQTRTVMRITLIKGYNMLHAHLQGYKKLVELARPHFIEVKAYMHIGYSRLRLKAENMPSHQEILSYSQDLARITGYRFVDHNPDSRVALLQGNRFVDDRFIKGPVPGKHFSVE